MDAKLRQVFIVAFVSLFSFMGGLLSVQAGDFVIVANSPTFSEKNVRDAIPNRTVIALDGAANHLKRCHITPQIILGDFDSVEDKEYWGIKGAFHAIANDDKPYLGNFSVLIMPAKNQDYTDLEKAIIYCDEMGAKSILIVNATGGRMDHTLGNIGLLRKHFKKERPLSLTTENECIEYIKDGQTTIKGNVGDQCAIMAYPEAFMTTTGLAYNGQNYQLKLGIQESSCNTLVEPEAVVVIQGEALIISPR